MAYPTGTRASDDDRNRVVDALATAFSEGQLDEAEYDERSKAALQAPTLAELAVLTEDLQTQPALEGAPDDGSALPPTHTLSSGPRVPWRLVLAAAAAVVVVGAAAFVVRAAIGSGDASPEQAAPTTPDAGGSGHHTTIPPLVIPETPDMFSAAGLDDMVAAMRREVGTTVVTALNVQPNAASFDVRRPGSPGEYSYYYDGFVGIPSYSQRTTDGGSLDLATLDTRAIAQQLRTLPRRLGISDPTTRYMTTDFGGGGRGSLTLYVSGPAGAGWAVVSPAGEVLRLQRP